MSTVRGIVLRDNAQHQKTVLLTVDNAVWYPFDVCGRYTVSKPSEILPELLGRDDLPQLAARYNIAPTQMAPVLVADPDCEPRLTEMQWGFVPYWADTPAIGHRLINARSETVAKKSTFRESFSRQRCVVAADGFYEWQQIPGGKQPYLLRFRGNAPFGFAGLWNRWRNSADQVLELLGKLNRELGKTILMVTHDRLAAEYAGETVHLDKGRLGSVGNTTQPASQE